MIILDTNVISELMRRRPDPLVVAFVDATPAATLWITSVTVFEIGAGIAALIESERRSGLDAAWRTLLAHHFGTRILPLDATAARHAGSLYGQQRRAGRVIGLNDTFIAGIAITHGASLATRNQRDFEDCGVRVINPWDRRP